MRIAIVHSFYENEALSGENIAVERQTRALRDAGHQIQVFGRRTSELRSVPGYRIGVAATVVSGLGPSPLYEIEAFEPDLVHVHNLFPNWGWRWLKQSQVPVISTVHNYRSVCPVGTLTRDGKPCNLCVTRGPLSAIDFACYRNSRLATLPLAMSYGNNPQRKLLELSDHVVVLSTRSRKLLEENGAPLGPRVSVIPNFCDVTPWEGRRVGFGGPAKWLFVGRISREKGIVDLLESWPADEVLTVIGDGPEMSRCKTVSRDKEIRFLGAIGQQQVREIMSRSHGLVFPSNNPENSPLVYAEALSHGLPVLAVSGNSLADAVDEEKTGMTFENINLLIAGLNRFSGYRSTFAKNAKKAFLSKYTSEIWVGKMLAVYHETLGARGSVR